jgi:hypothetical protein
MISTNAKEGARVFLVIDVLKPDAMAILALLGLVLKLIAGIEEHWVLRLLPPQGVAWPKPWR